VNRLKMILELVTLTFAWVAFDWKVAVLVFLTMWWTNVSRRVK